MPLAPALDPGQVGQRQPGLRQVAAHRLDRAEHGKRVRHPMLARLGDGEGELGARQDGGDQRSARRRGHDVAGPDVGAFAEAEAQHLRRIGPGGGGKPVAIGAVVGNESDSALLQALEDLALGVGNLLLAGEEGAMGRCDGGDDRDVRPDQAGQRGQLAFMVHPHLEHAEAGLARHPGERERNSGMVVVALHRPVRLAGRGAVERRVERLLGARSCRPSR